MSAATITPVDKARALMIARTEKLSDLACEVDGMRKDFGAVPAWYEALTQAVELLHGVAMECSDTFGLAIYANDDEPEAEAA